MSPADGQTINVNGTTLYFEVHGDGQPLLLVHGFSGTSQDWKPSLDQWGSFQIILPDMHGHGRSGILSKPFRHDDAAANIFSLLDHLKITTFKGVGISGGGNVLLHMATKQPSRIRAMVLVSATPYFPPQARNIMRGYAQALPPQEMERLRRVHPAGDAKVKALLESTIAFADSYDDLNFTPSLLSTIQARTLIIQGDRDPLYPVQLSLEMFSAIPNASLWIVPNSGHGPVVGAGWAEFVKTSVEFLQSQT